MKLTINTMNDSCIVSDYWKDTLQNMSWNHQLIWFTAQYFQTKFEAPWKFIDFLVIMDINREGKYVWLDDTCILKICLFFIFTQRSKDRY